METRASFTGHPVFKASLYTLKCVLELSVFFHGFLIFSLSAIILINITSTRFYPSSLPFGGHAGSFEYCEQNRYEYSGTINLDTGIFKKPYSQQQILNEDVGSLVLKLTHIPGSY